MCTLFILVGPGLVPAVVVTRAVVAAAVRAVALALTQRVPGDVPAHTVVLAHDPDTEMSL